MKRILFFIGLLLLVAGVQKSFCQDFLPRTKSALNLEGAVKTFMLSSYGMENQEGERTKGELKERHYMEFNDAGFVIIERLIRPDESRVEMVYTPEGFLQSQILYDAEGGILRGKKLEYDASHNLTEEKEYDQNDQLLYKTVYAYDENNQRIKEEFYNSDLTLRDYRLFQYDKTGQLTEERYFFDAGDAFEKRTYTYDDSGHKTVENRFDAEGTHTYRMRYRYDERGNRLEENNDLNLRYQGRHSVVKYTYDAHDKKTMEYKETQEGELSEKILFSYDSAGLLLEETWFDNEETLTLKKTMQYDGKGRLFKETRENGITHEVETYAYELDAKGNPNEILFSLDGAPVDLSEVKITYY